MTEKKSFFIFHIIFQYKKNIFYSSVLVCCKQALKQNIPIDTEADKANEMIQNCLTEKKNIKISFFFFLISFTVREQ